MLAEAWAGELKTIHDVAIESCHRGGVWVLANDPVPEDEAVMLDLTAGSVGIGIAARVAVSGPALRQGHMCYRLRLDAALAVADDAFESIVSPAPGALWRTASVQLLEVSRGGCVLEGRALLRVGMVGRLRATGPADARVEDGVRVTWCAPREGAGATWRAGLELLAMPKGVERSRQSLRDVLATLERGASAPPSPA